MLLGCLVMKVNRRLEVLQISRKFQLATPKASKNTPQRKHKSILTDNTLKRQRKLTSPMGEDFTIIDELDVDGKL